MASRNQFEVFGVDVRDYGQLWLVAWRDFLFGDDSPIRSCLGFSGHPKALQTEHRPVIRLSRKVESGSAVSEAYAIPDELVLSRSLYLPTIAEADLEAACIWRLLPALPLVVDDTASGWRITRGEDRRTLTVDLVIASRSAVMGFLGEHFGLTDPSVPEVWADTGTHWVRLRGFGEMMREADYRRRIIRSGVPTHTLFWRVFTDGGPVRDH